MRISAWFEASIGEKRGDGWAANLRPNLIRFQSKVWLGMQ